VCVIIIREEIGGRGALAHGRAGHAEAAHRSASATSRLSSSFFFFFFHSSTTTFSSNHLPSTSLSQVGFPS